MTTPQPHEWEYKHVFLVRFDKHLTVRHLHKTPAQRALAGERRWKQAKQESLVSLSGEKGEMLLYGDL